MVYNGIPSGKLTQNYRKSPFFNGKSTISMAIFNSKLLVYQRVNYWEWQCLIGKWWVTSGWNGVSLDTPNILSCVIWFDQNLLPSCWPSAKNVQKWFMWFMFSCQIAQLRWVASSCLPSNHGWNIHCFWGMLPPMSTRRPGLRLVCQQPGPLTGTQPPGPLGTNGGIKCFSFSSFTSGVSRSFIGSIQGPLEAVWYKMQLDFNWSSTSKECAQWPKRMETLYII
jgi:hypothetical protein